MTAAGVAAGPRLAVNPIPYWLAGGVPDKSTANLGRALTELAAIGYQAVKADVPTDMAASDYLPWLQSFGLSPALSLFSGSFDDPAGHRQVADQAAAYAAVQAGLGQQVCMISTFEPAGSPRRLHPAVGAGFDADRLEIIVAGVDAAARAMLAEGVRAALHPHVGGWIETEHEVRTVLDGISPDVLAFGPDTGHMFWAGMDVPTVLGDYADRIVGVHLKDTFAAGIVDGRAADLDYHTATAPGLIWAEPGTGQADLVGCVAAIPATFRGDFMIEVDVPTMPLRECHQLAYQWARAHLPIAS